MLKSISFLELLELILVVLNKSKIGFITILNSSWFWKSLDKIFYLRLMFDKLVKLKKAQVLRMQSNPMIHFQNKLAQFTLKIKLFLTKLNIRIRTQSESKI